MRRVAELETELKAERERARNREDQLLDRVLTAAGRHALTPEPKARHEREKPEPPISAIDEARLQAYREAAVRAGKPASEGDRLWKAQRNGKPIQVGLPDEPYVIPQ